MPAERQRRFIVLLLLALLVPCGVLAVLGIRVIRQERELAAKRLADQRQILSTQACQELLGRLERVKLEAQNTLAQPASELAEPLVALAARVADGRFVLPWEEAKAKQDFLSAIGAAGFAGKIREGEQQEFREKQPGSAADRYEEALKLSRLPAQAAHARLLLARVLAKSGRLPGARLHFLKLLALPSSLTDDQGVPFCLYAANRLAGEEVIRDVLRGIIDQPGWLAPPSYYMMAELAESLSDDTQELQRAVEARIRDVEQVLALQSEFPNLAVFEHTPDGEPLWARFGEPAWLVSVAPPLGKLPSALVAVRAAGTLQLLPPGPLRFLTAREPGAWPAAGNFPGLYLSFATPPGDSSGGWGLRQSFYLAALLLVLSTTLLAAYLLWRDVRRELHIAEMRAQFVSSVSHELKTPLTAIRMFAETLRMRRWEDEQTQHEYLDTIVNESQRLARLVDNVLDFSRIERGKKIYNLKPASLAEVVRAAARAVQYPLSQQGFRLNAEVEDDLPLVRADADALEQAVLNLLTNAMKYSGDSRQIGLRLRRVDGRARIEVSDRGIGISPEERGRIFEKFYRVQTRENQLIPGTGLGLTLVEHVAKAHGGEVKVESQPGQGSTFSIELPLGGGE